MSPAKQRRVDPDVEEVARQQKRRTVPGAGGPVRKRLAVGPGHKTPAMRKGRRGSYP